MKFLIVDDNKFNLFIMTKLIAEIVEDSHIDTAQTVDSAYQYFLTNDYDLVITDGDLNNNITGPMFARLMLNKKPDQMIAGWTDCTTKKEEFSHVFKLARSSENQCMVWQKDINEVSLHHILAPHTLGMRPRSHMTQDSVLSTCST